MIHRVLIRVHAVYLNLRTDEAKARSASSAEPGTAAPHPAVSTAVSGS